MSTSRDRAHAGADPSAAEAETIMAKLVDAAVLRRLASTRMSTSIPAAESGARTHSEVDTTSPPTESSTREAGIETGEAEPGVHDAGESKDSEDNNADAGVAREASPPRTVRHTQLGPRSLAPFFDTATREELESRLDELRDELSTGDCSLLTRALAAPPGASSLGASAESALRTILRRQSSLGDDTHGFESHVLLPGTLHRAETESSELERLSVALQLERDIRASFGTSNFVTRAQRTAEVLGVSLRLLDEVLTYAGIRRAVLGSAEASVASTSSSYTGSAPSTGFSGNQPDPMLLFCLLRMKEAAAVASLAQQELAETRAQQDAAANQLDKAYDQLYQHEAELVRVKTWAEKRSGETVRERLEAKCNQLAEENQSYANQLEDARHAPGPGRWLSEEQVEHLYDFIWRHGHFGGTAEELYQLIRAAATGVPGDLGSGNVMLAFFRAPGPQTPKPAPPAIDTLAAYAPLPSPARSASRQAGTSRTSSASPAAGRTRESSTSFETPPAKRNRVEERTPTRSAASSAADSFVALRLQLQFDEESDEKAATSSQARRRSTAPHTRTGSASRPTAPVIDLVDSDSSPGAKAAPRPATTSLASQSPVAQFLVHSLSPAQPRDCIAIPHAAGQELTQCEFDEVDIPYTLGSVVGRSSTVKTARSMTVGHLGEVFGMPTQLVSGQSTFFPNYTPARIHAAIIMDHLGGNGNHDAYDALLETCPWDDMWHRRETRLFLFDPNQLAQVQVDWLDSVLRFMHKHRRDFWVRGHWICLSRNVEVDRGWRSRYQARQQADTRFVEAFGRLMRSAPKGMTDLIWSEPAIWFAPARQCPWAVRPVDEISLEDQLYELDLLEPIRAQWVSAPERFVEGLLEEQVQLLEENGGICWELHSPWNEGAYEPDD